MSFKICNNRENQRSYYKIFIKRKNLFVSLNAKISLSTSLIYFLFVLYECCILQKFHRLYNITVTLVLALNNSIKEHYQIAFSACTAKIVDYMSIRCMTKILNFISSKKSPR